MVVAAHIVARPVVQVLGEVIDVRHETACFAGGFPVVRMLPSLVEWGPHYYGRVVPVADHGLLPFRQEIARTPDAVDVGSPAG